MALPELDGVYCGTRTTSESICFPKSEDKILPEWLNDITPQKTLFDKKEYPQTLWKKSLNHRKLSR